MSGTKMAFVVTPDTVQAWATTDLLKIVFAGTFAYLFSVTFALIWMMIKRGNR